MLAENQRAIDQEEYDGEDGEAGDGVFEKLIDPEMGIRAALGFFELDAMAAEDVDVGDDEKHHQRREQSGVQGEEEDEESER